MSLSRAFETVREVDPPAGLREAILDALPAQKEPSFFIGLLGGMADAFRRPATLRFGGAFALGALATFIVLQTVTVDRGTELDISSLAGTMARHEALSASAAADVVRLDLAEVAGAVSLHDVESMLIVQFDLDAREPVEVVAGLGASDMRFGGFVQKGDGFQPVVADGQRISMTSEGEHSFAVFLDNQDSSAATVELQFYAGGALIHQDMLRYEGSN